MSVTGYAFLQNLGPPDATCKSYRGTLHIWSRPPVVLTQVEGVGTREIAEKLVAHYREHYTQYDDVVTINEWSGLTDYEPEARKIMQNLTREMQPKQRELIIHLGKAGSLVQKVVRAAVDALIHFRRLTIEIFNDDALFEARAEEILKKYHP